MWAHADDDVPRRRAHGRAHGSRAAHVVSISTTSGEAGGGDPHHRRARATELARALATLGVRERVLDHPDGERRGRRGRAAREVRAVLDDVTPTPSSSGATAPPADHVAVWAWSTRWPTAAARSACCMWRAPAWAPSTASTTSTPRSSVRTELPTTVSPVKREASHTALGDALLDRKLAALAGSRLVAALGPARYRRLVSDSTFATPEWTSLPGAAAERCARVA